jgi:hypothetical protein
MVSVAVVEVQQADRCGLCVRLDIGLRLGARQEVALQDIGHVRITHARDATGVFRQSTAQSHLLHQALHALVVDGLHH